MTMCSVRRRVRYWLAAACVALAPWAWAHPCDGVLQTASQAAHADQAEAALGACLAAEGPAHIQLQVARELLQRSRGQPLACRYAEIVERMLEFPLPELDDATLAGAADAARVQACDCDRQWLRDHALQPQEQRPSWFGEDTPQALLAHAIHLGADSAHELVASYRRGMDHVCLFVGDHMRHAQSRGAVSSGFVHGELFAAESDGQPVAVLLWQAGMRGQLLQVIDMTAGHELLKVRSDWPVNYRLQEGALHYEQFRERTDGEGLEAVTSVFPLP